MVRTRQFSPEAAAYDGGQVDSLQRGLEVLRLFDIRHSKLSLTDIAGKLGLSRQTAEKLIYTLQAQNFLRPVGKETFEPHVACLALGRAVKRDFVVGQTAQPLMLDLSQRYGVHVILSARDRLHMLVVEHCVPTGKVRLGLTTGARFAMAVSASGRAYLWGQPLRQREQLLKQIELEAAPGAYKQLSGIYAAFQELEQQGWCYLVAPVANQTASIATPVSDGVSARFALAAMAVGPGVTEAMLREQVAPELLAMAQRIALVTGDIG